MVGASGNGVEPSVFAKTNSFGAGGERISPNTTGNGSPAASRDSTPVPPVTYQVEIPLTSKASRENARRVPITNFAIVLNRTYN